MKSFVLATLILSSQFAIAQDQLQPFKLREGEKIAFDNISLSGVSKFRPYGPALTISTPLHLASPFWDPFGPLSLGEVDIMNICELSALNVKQRVAITSWMTFTVASARPAPSLTFYTLVQDDGPLQLRLICRPDANTSAVSQILKIIPKRH